MDNRNVENIKNGGAFNYVHTTITIHGRNPGKMMNQATYKDIRNPR
jgi:hypothetical protein